MPKGGLVRRLTATGKDLLERGWQASGLPAGGFTEGAGGGRGESGGLGRKEHKGNCGRTRLATEAVGHARHLLIADYFVAFWASTVVP